jgi:hypothetical protein
MDKANGSETDIVDSIERNSSRSSTKWHFFGRLLPRSEIVFFAQVILVYIVVIVSIVNLTIGSDEDKLWIALLSSSIGYILPSPSLKLNKK